MDVSGNEFQDWEVLHHDTFAQISDSNSRTFDGFEGDAFSAGIIRLDYFALSNHEMYTKPAVESTVSEECFVGTENLSSISGSDDWNCARNISELGDGLLDEEECNESHVEFDYGLADSTKTVKQFEEITSEAKNLERRASDDVELSARDELVSSKDMSSPVDSEELFENETQEILDKFNSNSSCNESVTLESGDGRKESEISNDHTESVNNSNEEFEADDEHTSEEVDVAMEEVKIVEAKSYDREVKKVEAKSGDGEVKRRVVWWKIPFELLKFCFLRASPAWSLSVAAAAFMGIMILGRRLFKMKRKSKGFQLKIAMDDKKVSQFASQAARLNEAFLMVRRVPVVRASLTAAAPNSWPAINIT